MNGRNIRLIFQRELRDQLRDRRTLMTMMVLPLLLYPLLGISFLQITQFLREHPTIIRVVGAEGVTGSPELFEEGRFAAEWFSKDEARLTEIRHDGMNADLDVDALKARALREIQAGQYDALVYFPPDFGQSLAEFRKEVQQWHTRGAPPSGASDAEPRPVPAPLVLANRASDKSKMAAQRIERVLRHWRDAVVQETLQANNIPTAATEPFAVRAVDVSEERGQRAALWSKILPFVILIWALTGAFYPAIDLCAGEKERGTLETLLSSPASRTEIVLGKLFTTMTFSIATAVLNVACMALTATLFLRQLELDSMGAGHFGAPPWSSLGWLFLALIPTSALFSALSLAVASFARSSKEGQYYLMPLLLVTLPLMVLPLLPTADLNLGTSLIPVTGIMLLLRALIEAQYIEACWYAPGVLAMSGVGCFLAIRWAIEQFSNENVLFRESERWDLGLLVRHLIRDRQRVPTFAQAFLGGVFLLLVRFGATLMSRQAPDSWSAFASSTVTHLVVFFALPAVLLSLLLTRSIAETLQLRWPRPAAMPLAALLAITLHPLGIAVAHLIQRVYEVNDQWKSQVEQIAKLIHDAPNLGAVLAVMAITPALCEELAFRGFILQGLRSCGRNWVAILISSALFGAAHQIIQQSIAAFLLGLVIGLIAVRSGSIFPGMVFHLVYNSLSLVLSLGAPVWRERWPIFNLVCDRETGEPSYHIVLIIIGTCFAAWILIWFQKHGSPKLPAGESPAEVLPVA